ncbi:MAG: MFS transporter [Bacteroidetes bacterium]|nr:MFS transporter [Bacteroidota bacterium]
MPKVILQISYEIKPEKREEYLELAKELKNHFAGERKNNYMIFEQKSKKNFFVEQFVCNSIEEYESLEDGITESGEELVNRLETLIKDGKARYATLLEVQ